MVVSLGTVVDSTGLMLVDTPSTRIIEGASRRNAPWRNVDVMGQYLVDGADTESPSALQFRPLRRRLLVLPRPPLSAEETDRLVGQVAAQRAVGILTSNTVNPALSASCHKYGQPLFVPPAGHATFDCSTRIHSVLVNDLRGRLDDPSYADADQYEEDPEHFSRLLDLLDHGAYSAGAVLHLVTPGALINPVVALSPAFRAAVLARAAIPLERLTNSGRAVHIELERPGYSLLLTRDAPSTWSREGVKGWLRPSTSCSGRLLLLVAPAVSWNELSSVNW